MTSFYPGTGNIKEENIKWKLFVQERFGTWRELRGPQKIGKKVSFTFPEKWLGHKLLIEAFLYNSEKKSPPGLIVIPKPSKIPRITGVELLYVDNSKGSTFSFKEKVKVKATTVGMFNKELTFTLWEDDATNGGHNPNNKPIDSLNPKPRVDKDGFAFGEFTLSKAFMLKAMQGETDPKQLEFYVTVEYYTKKKHATENVNINNPFPQAQKPKPAGKAIEIVKAKGSPAENKPKSKKEEKGILDRIEEKLDELWDWWETPGTIKKEQPPTTQKPEGRSPAVVKEHNTPEKKSESCVCKQYDLIWGGHKNVDCSFRKKVVEICADLWGDQNKIKMANNLMAVFKWESGGTFKPDAPNQANSGGTGLIQFMPDTAKKLLGHEVTIEIVKNYWGKKYNKKTKTYEDWYLKRVKEFAHMSALQQLDYVKKYFEPLRGRTVEFVDFYLQVLFPASSGKEEHIVFASSMDKLTTRVEESEKVRNLRINAYSQNSGLEIVKDGKIWKSEIKTKVQVYITEGLSNKETSFECDEVEQKATSPEITKCPDDFSQCFNYADVVENPRLNNQSANVNKNRFHREKRYNKKHPRPKGYYHTGTDILAKLNTDVKSMLCGEVVEAIDTNGDLGKIVTVQSKDENGKFIWIRYCHLNLISVSKGQKIKHGNNIGKSGNTGNAKDILPQYYHVHIEASTDGVFFGGNTRVDPEQFMKTKFDETVKGNTIK